MWKLSWCDLIWKCKIHIKDIGVLLRVRQRFWCIQDQIVPISLYLLPIIQILLITVEWDCLKLGGLLDPYVLKNSSLSIFAVLQSNQNLSSPICVWKLSSRTTINSGINQEGFNKANSTEQIVLIREEGQTGV